MAPKRLRGMRVKEALSSLTSREPLKVAVAIATLNALSHYCFHENDAESYRIKRHMDAMDAVPMPLEKSVAVIGAIVPALQMLKERGGNWWVIEQDPRTLKGEEKAHFVPDDQSGEIISRADVLLITGVTLVNHTLESILDKTRPDAEIVVMGPTASMLPDPFFKRNVSVVGGVWVHNVGEMLAVLAVGGSGYHFMETHAERIVIVNTHKAPSDRVLKRKNIGG